METPPVWYASRPYRKGQIRLGGPLDEGVRYPPSRFPGTIPSSAYPSVKRMDFQKATNKNARICVGVVVSTVSFAQFLRLRRANPTPEKPSPSKPSVAGSGTSSVGRHRARRTHG